MQKPNILLIMTDQLRAFSLGSYGNHIVKTPNIDRLAREGVRFEQAISNCPVCTPARSCCLTGQYARTCAGDEYNSEDEPPVRVRRRLTDQTLAESLRSAGYHMRLIGKWHIDPDPLLVGFDVALWPYIRHRYENQWFYRAEEINGSRNPFQMNEQLAPDFECEEACRFLAGEHDKPFFLYYNISPPHMPFADMPEKYRKMYDPGVMPLRQNVKLEGSDHDWWYRTYLWDHRYCKLKEPHTLSLPKGFGLRELTALYYGMISWADDIVGRLMESLRISGLENNTIVLFTSDHGDNLGSHGFFNKDRLMEESIRIPMIIRWPERLAPLDNRQHQAQLIDIMPTLLDLAGCEIPPSVQGHSLSPLLYGQATMGDNLVFIETPLKHIGIRTATHKYGMLLRNDYSIDNEEFCFYDLVADPYEEHNLIGTGKQEETAKILRDILGRWHLETPRLSLAKDTEMSQ